MLTAITGNVYTPQAMATEKTIAVSARVPISIAARLSADAEELGVPPGTLLRRLLEGRYSSRADVGKTNTASSNSDREMVSING